ncbi:hypothetical protein [Streptomyces sp. NPDC089919]|uniref:hypothetical protein n=1 Tax=Streptomyces sp. NPDC089919 TaxID=3155188 RepID=UPI003436F6C0
MSIRYTANAHRGLAAAAVTVLALSLTGCGSDDGGKQKTAAPSAKSQTTKASQEPSEATSAEPDKVIATLQGADGVVFTINEAARDAGGFLTISGQIKNTGSKTYTGTVRWRGNELTASGLSIAGATLVDTVGKKRYYVLRDTDGRCLCTTGLNSLKPGEVVPAFAQFPAPPDSTTQVGFSLPTFATATIQISG